MASIATVAIALAAAGAGGRAGAQAPGRPNVLVILTDDQRFNTIRALGAPGIATPNLDRLVRRGTAFTRAHIMGGLQGAVCAPSRAMLLTGRTLFSLKGVGNEIPPEHTMLPELLRRAGYTTFATGKWHNDRAAFARAFAGADNIFFGGMHWPKEGGHEAPHLFRFDPSGRYPPESRFQADRYSSALYADAAVAFLDAQRDGGSPFFAYVAFTSPHDPRTPPPAFAARYDPASIELPPNVAPDHPFDNGELKVRDELLLPRPLTPDMVRRELALYYGMISEVDAQIGRILDALERRGLTGRTLIVFAGDNGLAVGSHGLLGKQNLYEESVRVPLVMAGPGIPAGETRDTLCYLLDVAPTAIELIGLERPATVEGISLVPALRDRRTHARDEVLLAYRDVQRGIRTADDWKLIEYRVGGGLRHQLFHLSADPWEVRDLAEHPAHAARLGDLQARLARLARAHGDPAARP